MGVLGERLRRDASMGMTLGIGMAKGGCHQESAKDSNFFKSYKMKVCIFPFSRKCNLMKCVANNL